MRIRIVGRRPANAERGKLRRAILATLVVLPLAAAGAGAARAAGTTALYCASPTASATVSNALSKGFSAASNGSSTDVVVTGLAQSPTNAVSCANGAVDDSLSVLNAVHAQVANDQLTDLLAQPGVSVYPDVPVSVQSTVASTGPHTPSDDFLQETGATTLASAGDTGQGVTVAVLDTGISSLPDFSGRLIGGVDFTSARNPYSDAYGHGTFVAGLIAGTGASSGGQYSGEAPGANLVSIKVAGATGVTDLATVMAGVGWAIQHRTQYNIRVLNISLGFQPISSTLLNPLDWAVDQAWAAGITVVTSAGNAGPFNGSILSPGDDPMAVTVGSLDDMTTPSVTDDEMNDFSSAGPTSPDGWVKPDLVSSGRSVVSLGAPGSTIWTQNPAGRLGTANFVGSGTSFSAAITSGAAALVLGDNPTLSPNQIKARLLGTTTPGPVGNPFVDGHGALNAAAAATSGDLEYSQSTAGLASVAFGTTVSLANNGPADTWNPALWGGSAWNGSAWNSAAWNGSAWNGSAWNSAAWNGSAWNGSAWNGSAWNSAAWNGA
ncbi:MAG TPA: S8 family peptidase, partial [Acidimicrobiales bacterium]|nr:S8 family peptidase [Acidimicrobiales bacterium]